MLRVSLASALDDPETAPFVGGRQLGFVFEQLVFICDGAFSVIVQFGLQRKVPAGRGIGFVHVQAGQKAVENHEDKKEHQAAALKYFREFVGGEQKQLHFFFALLRLPVASRNASLSVFFTAVSP